MTSVAAMAAGSSAAAILDPQSTNKLREIDQHITNKYEIVKRLGKGAYGIVWKGKSRRSGRVVAVKKIFDAFRNKTDAQRTFREIIFLKEFRDHPNIIRLLNVHRADNDKDLYLVFEFMNTDLQRAIQRPGILKDIHKRFIMYQLLSATQYLHSGNVVHRDQKPSNILLDTECNCKIADFGLARSLSVVDSTNALDNGALTDYVATRWYRAPEILLGCKRYTKGVDLWSLGCILGEMLIGKPLFPGSSTVDQIEKIFSKLEPGSFHKFKQSCTDYVVSLKNVDNKASKQSRGGGGHTIYESELGGCAEDAIDLVRKLLKIVPEERSTADSALSHPYVIKFHNPAAERVMKRDIIPPLSDDIQLSIDQYRDKLYEIIRRDRAVRR